MSFLLFKDDELNIMFQVINNLQMCFHHQYAPEGKFTFMGSEELQNKNQLMIIADKNIVSPICEIARNGHLKDDSRMRKVAIFVVWTKYLGAQLTCGIGLLENDTAQNSDIIGEETRQQFLHGIDQIPPHIWKHLAFGDIDSVPDIFLYKKQPLEDTEYDFSDNILYLCNEAAIIKIVELLRTPNVSGIDKFITFMKWYADNLNIAESMMVYAALLFGNIPNVASPKGINSTNFTKTLNGIKNQAWDITYITAWSTMYYNENDDQCYMFATDDNTQKIITVNIIPPGSCADAIDAIFHTNSQTEKLKKLATEKLGDARVNTFITKSKDEQIAFVKKLIDEGLETIKKL